MSHGRARLPSAASGALLVSLLSYFVRTITRRALDVTACRPVRAPRVLSVRSCLLGYSLLKAAVSPVVARAPARHDVEAPVGPSALSTEPKSLSTARITIGMPKNARTSVAASDEQSDHWSGTPVMLSQFKYETATALAAHISSEANTTFKRGCNVTTRGQTIVWNSLHAATIFKTASDGDARPTYNWDNPAPSASHWDSMLQKARAAALAAVAADMSANATTAGYVTPATASILFTVTLSTAAAGSEYDGVPPPVNITILISPFTPTGLMTDADKAGFIISPLILEQHQRDVYTFVTNRITATTIREDLLKICHEDATLLIIELRRREDLFAVAYGNAIEAQFTAHLASGISSATTESYIQFRQLLEIYNRAMGKSRRRSQAILASNLADAACLLGDKIRTEVRTGIKLEKCENDFNATDEQIQMAIGQLESEQLASIFRSGRSLIGRDPDKAKREEKPWNSRDWRAGDPDCPGCKRDDKDASHWIKNCPFRKPPKPPAKGKGKMGKAAPPDDDSSDDDHTEALLREQFPDMVFTSGRALVGRGRTSSPSNYPSDYRGVSVPPEESYLVVGGSDDGDEGMERHYGPRPQMEYNWLQPGAPRPRPPVVQGKIYMITTATDPGPGFYRGEMGPPDHLTRHVLGRVPPVGLPASKRYATWDDALRGARQMGCPAIYYGPVDDPEVTYGEGLPGSTEADRLGTPPIVSAPAPEPAPEPPQPALVTNAVVLHEDVTRAVYTLCVHGYGGDIPNLQQLTGRTVNRARDVLAAAGLATSALAPADIKAAAWMAIYASERAPIIGHPLRRLAYATLRSRLAEAATALIGNNVASDQLDRAAFISQVPHLAAAFASCIRTATAAHAHAAMIVEEALIFPIADVAARADVMDLWAPAPTPAAHVIAMPPDPPPPDPPPSPPAISRIAPRPLSILLLLPVVALLGVAAGHALLLDNGAHADSTTDPSTVPRFLVAFLSFLASLACRLAGPRAPIKWGDKGVHARDVTSPPPTWTFPHHHPPPSRYERAADDAARALFRSSPSRIPAALALCAITMMLSAGAFLFSVVDAVDGASVYGATSEWGGAATPTSNDATTPPLARGLLALGSLALRYWHLPPEIPRPTTSPLLRAAFITGIIVECARADTALARAAVRTATRNFIEWAPGQDWEDDAWTDSTPTRTRKMQRAKFITQRARSRRANRRAAAPPPLPPPSPPSPPPDDAATSSLSPPPPSATRARACISRRKRRPAASSPARALAGRDRSISLIIDSGCTWHMHNRLSDLINVRGCRDSLVGLEDTVVECRYIGDLPVSCTDSSGERRTLLIRNVRYADSSDALVSVRQLWREQGIDVAFRDTNALRLVHNGHQLDLPFKWDAHEGVYIWKPLSLKQEGLSATTLAKCLVGKIHRGATCSHIARLAADAAAHAMHRRLHLGAKRLRSLPLLCADAPPQLRSASEVSCPFVTEANARHLPHTGSRYQPSHPGRLIHSDIAGPFLASTRGHRYVLVVVDDHSRFKTAFCMKRKSDAPQLIRRFIAGFNARLSANSSTPIRAVGHHHSDNAGEFVSREFTELLDSNLVHQTTSPPHISDLNGVAERAIRSIMEGVRADLAQSKAPIGFWNKVVEHNVDILNRSTCPPDSDISCYQAFTGEKPTIMHVMPFGCAAWAVKPSSMVAKTSIDMKAWDGINLGRSIKSPGGYDVWVPSLQRVVCTSDVYFAESWFPWRPNGDRLVGDLPGAPPPSTGADQPPGIPSAGAALPTVALGAPPDGSTVAGAVADALGQGAAARSRRVLVLFSGPYSRPDGLGAFLRQSGFEVDLIDNDRKHGGGEDHDICNNDFFDSLLARVRTGYYFAIFAAPPCSTFSISRFFTATRAKQNDGGPPPVRTRRHPAGLPQAPQGHASELRRANRIVDRTCILLAAASEAGTHFAIENPSDRSNRDDPTLFINQDHGSLWNYPTIVNLMRKTHAGLCTFAMCAFGAPYQKYTTLAFSAGLASKLEPLDQQRCTHSSHERRAGGNLNDEGEWISAGAAAYPPDFNLFVARSLRDIRFGADPTEAPETRHAATAPEPTAAARAPMGPAPFADNRDGEGTVPDGPVQAATPHVAVATATDSIDTTNDDDHDADASPPPPSDSPSPAARKFRKGDSQDASDPKSWAFTKPRTRAQKQGAAFLIRGLPLGPDILDAFDAGRRRARALKAASANGEPANHREAMLYDSVNWGKAEVTEIENHRSNGSFTEIDRSAVPKGRRLVRLTWAYKLKRDGRFKARLCVQGCSQVAGVDYDQTFCSTMRSGSLRLLCAASAHFGLRMRRWDFVAAYLQGELEEGETIYCSLPPGYEWRLNDKGERVPNVGADGLPRVFRVEKPVYGMAQSGRRWQRSLFPWLLEQGFTQSKEDSCIFTIMRSVDTPDGKRDEKLILGCYVDDLCAAYSHDDEHSLYHHFTKSLTDRWEVEDEGEVSDLLNVEIERRGNCVLMHQCSYIERLLTTHSPDGVPKEFQSTKTPAGPELAQLIADALVSEVAPPEALLREYQSLVGALLYCSTNTRPDIAYSVGMLCRVMAKPTPSTLLAARRVLYYLHRTRELGLRFVACQRPLEGMTDADWAIKHSTSGWVFRFSQAAISWGTKKQKSVALSSCEAEIVAASEAAKEGVYLRRFLGELGLQDLDRPVTLASDNKAAINSSYNPENHDRTKHVERRHYFIRECVENHLLTVPYVNTVDNLADFFTKPLQGNAFNAMRDRIMNCDSRALRAARHGSMGGCS